VGARPYQSVQNHNTSHPKNGHPTTPSATRKIFILDRYALNQAWLDRHPDDLAVWPNYIESHLTTGRFAEVSALLAKVFAKLSPAEQVPLLAIEVFALVGQGKPVETASQRKALRTLRFSEGIPLLLYKELPR